MAVRALNAINLCDGYGGFSIALEPFGVRTVARVERDGYAAAVLVERMGQARLDLCPIWDDLTTFDGAAWRGRVHIVTAGLPCQPFSAAGERRGVDDDRHLWPYMRRIVADVGPEFVILENVPGFVRGGLPEVLSDLAALGFDAQWGLLSAADVGAPHRRDRFWCVAHADGDGVVTAQQVRERLHDVDALDGAVADTDRDGLPQIGDGFGGRQTRDDADRCLSHVEHAHGVRDGRQRDAVGRQVGRSETEGTSPHVGDTCREGRPEVTGGSHGDARASGRRSDGDHVTDRPNQNVGDAACSGRVEGHRPAARQRWTDRTEATIGFPPLRDDHDGWRDWIDSGRPQPVLRRDLDGPPTGLADALHLGGNGLVPQTAHEAIRQLLERGGWEMTA